MNTTGENIHDIPIVFLPIFRCCSNKFILSLFLIFGMDNPNSFKNICSRFLDFLQVLRPYLSRETSYTNEERGYKGNLLVDNLKVYIHFLNRLLFLNFLYQLFYAIHDLNSLNALRIEHLKAFFPLSPLSCQIFNNFHHSLI